MEGGNRNAMQLSKAEFQAELKAADNQHAEEQGTLREENSRLKVDFRSVIFELEIAKVRSALQTRPEAHFEL